MPDTNVQNALTPEEKPIIENIVSLFQQLLAMQGAQDQSTDQMLTEAMGEDQNMEEVDVAKAVTEETGDDKAEDRINNQTDITDQSLTDLNKSITKLTNVLSGKRVVKKNIQPQAVNNDAQNQIFKQLGTLLNKIVEKQDAQEQLNAQLFDAMGFTDDVIKKALPAQEPVNKSKPVQSLDSAAVIKEVLSEVFKNIPALQQNPDARHSFNQKRNGDDGVRKNLKQIADFIHYGKSK